MDEIQRRIYFPNLGIIFLKSVKTQLEKTAKSVIQKLKNQTIWVEASIIVATVKKYKNNKPAGCEQSNRGNFT
jgi:hypothetical protein